MILLLIKKELYGLKNRLNPYIVLFLSIFIATILSTVFFVSKIGFEHILNIDKVTINLIVRLFSIGIIILTPAVILSSLFSGIYTLFESNEQEYIFKSPFDISRYYLFLLIKVCLHSSTFPILLFTTAIFALSKIQGYDYLLTIHVLLATTVFFFSLNFLLLSILTICFRFFKAAKFKEWIFTVLIISSVFLILLLRLSSPERLVETSSRMHFYKLISSMRLPVSPFSPPSWISQSIFSYIDLDGSSYIFYSSLLLIFGLLSCLFSLWVAKTSYFKAWQNYRKEVLSKIKNNDRLYSKSILKTLIKKEYFSLKNDKIQFSQFILLLVMVIIYLFNLYSLKSKVEFDIQYMFIIYFNIFFTIMITAALSTRFIFSSLSMEGKGIVHILSIISMKTLLKSKAIFYGVPLFLLSIILSMGGLFIIGSNLFITLFTLLNVTVLSIIIIYISLNYSLKYMDSNITSPDQMIFSYGAIKLMVVIFVIASIVLTIELPFFINYMHPHNHFFHHFFKHILDYIKF